MFALLLRTVLVPAVMHLLGDRNWWLPRALDPALPNIKLENETIPALQRNTAAIPPEQTEDATA